MADKLEMMASAGQPCERKDPDEWRAQTLLFRGLRQALRASNIANADTPGYQGRDMNSRDILAQSSRQSLAVPAMTSTAHIPGTLLTPDRGTVEQGEFALPSQPSLDNSTVDMDRERASAMQNTILYYAAIMSLKEELDDFKQAASGSSL